MRILMPVLLLAALALSVYNVIEVRRLQAQVAELHTRVAASRKPEAPDTQARARALLREAREHSERAQALMVKGDLAGAQREARKSMDLIAEAKRLDEGTDLVAQIRERTEGLLAKLRHKEGAKSQ